MKMEIKIQSAVEIDKKFKEYIEEKFGKLDKFVFGKGVAELYITKEKHLYSLKIRVDSKNSSIFIEESSDDIAKGIESLYSRTKRQLRKQHDKITNKSHN